MKILPLLLILTPSLPPPPKKKQTNKQQQQQQQTNKSRTLKNIHAYMYICTPVNMQTVWPRFRSIVIFRMCQNIFVVMGLFYPNLLNLLFGENILMYHCGHKICVPQWF